MPDDSLAVTAPVHLPTAAAALRRELRAWAAVAISALAVAGVFALLLALSRIPGIERIAFWPLDFFAKGLVIHVVFSFVVWFAAVFAALATVAAARLAGGPPPLPGLGLAAAAAAAAAMPLLFIPALLERGEPTLNNYVPVIIDPLYYAGLALLAGAIGLVALRLLAVARPAALRRDPPAAATAAAAVALLVALLCFAVALNVLAGSGFSFDFNEALMWGGGHLLQFVNTLLLLVAWTMLASPWSASISRPLGVASALLLLGALAGPLFYFLFPPFSPAQTAAFTWLQYLLGPAAAIVAIALLMRLPQPLPRGEPAFVALTLSMLLFAVGGTLGLFVDGTDTRTPAHYHGMIAGVTLAFFGLIFVRLLPMLGREAGSPRRQRLILRLFAWGQLAACIGLFAAGGHGAPRKVAGAAQGLHDVVAKIGMGLNGLGGLIAVIGGILFIWTVGSALLRTPVAAKPGVHETSF